MPAGNIFSGLFGGGSGAPTATSDPARKVFTVPGLKPGSTATLYDNGTQTSTATVDGTGRATWTLSTAPAAGHVMTFDGMITGSAGTIPAAAPPPVSLGALALSLVSATAGSTWSATISGKTAGSTIAATSSDGTTLTISGSTVSGTFGAAGSPTVTLTETLAGATNSPKGTAVQITVASAPSGTPSGGALDFSDPANSGLHPGL